MDTPSEVSECGVFVSQELIEITIDQLAGDNGSLKRCSLVSRKWAPRCRYHLLKRLLFSNASPAHSLERWRDTFGVSNAALASLTRELHFHQREQHWMHPAKLALHRTHLSHFTNVTTLVFVNLVTRPFHTVPLTDCFGSFARNVRRLRLYRPITRPVSLIHCVLLFPAVTDIDISDPQWATQDEDGNTPAPRSGSVRFTGTLHLRGFLGRWVKFLGFLSMQSIGFRRVRLIGCDFQNPTIVRSLLAATSRNVRTLHLVPLCGLRPQLDFTFEGFPVLQNFGFVATEVGTNGDLARLLDSVSSPEFSTFVLDVSPLERRCTKHQQLSEEMTPLDWPLSRLATRTFWKTGRRVTLTLLANNPTAAVEPLTEFMKVGNAWKGERVIGVPGSDYYWSFLAAKDCQFGSGTFDNSVLDSLIV